MRICPTCGEQAQPNQQTCLSCNTAMAVVAAKSIDPLSLVFGILGLVFCGCFPLSIVAVVVAKQREKTHNTTAAFVCGLIGLILGIIAAIFYIIYWGAIVAIIAADTGLAW